jgi:membrane protease YdiL (CAAX protease family)
LAKKNWKEIAVFLTLTLVFSSIFWVIIIVSGFQSKNAVFYVFGLMWSPGVAGIITCLIYQKSLRCIGWKWGKTRYQALSIFLPIVYAAVSYSVVWLVKWGKINKDFSLDIVQFLTIGVFFSLLFALGEEIGWRGYLVPRLFKVTSFTSVSLISGMIWAVWHYPLIIFSGYHGGTSILYSLVCFTIMVVGTSFAYAWLRLISGSVWTGMFFHGMHNHFVQSFFDPLTSDTGITPYIIGEFGVALAVAGIVVAFIFWIMRHRLNHTRLYNKE